MAGYDPEIPSCRIVNPAGQIQVIYFVTRSLKTEPKIR